MAKQKSTIKLEQDIAKTKLKLAQLEERKKAKDRRLKEQKRKTETRMKIILGGLISDMDYYEVIAMKKSWEERTKGVDKEVVEQNIALAVGDYVNEDWEKTKAKHDALVTEIEGE